LWQATLPSVVVLKGKSRRVISSLGHAATDSLFSQIYPR